MSEIDTGKVTAETSVGTVESTGQEIDAGPGEAVFFDELDDVLKAKKAQKKEPKEDNKGKSNNSDTLDVPEKKDSKKDGSKDAEKAEDEKPPKTEEKDPKEDQKPAVKLKKAKHGEKEIEIPEDAAFTVKVNGQEVDVSLNELMQNYSGKVAWDKKFSEVDRKDKEYSRKFNEIEGKVKAIFEEKDPEMRFLRMAQFAGQDPVQVRAKFLEDNINLLEKYYAMSEDERKADALEFENRILKQQREAQQREAQEQAVLQELDSKVKKVLASHKVSKEEFVDRYDVLSELVSKGQLSKDQLTPEFVAESLTKDSYWAAAESVLQPLGVKVDSQKMLKLVDMAYLQGLEAQDVAELAKELWAISPAKAVIEDKTAVRQEVLRGKKDIPEVPKSSEAMFFEDIL